MAFVIYTTDICVINRLLQIYAFLETVKVAMHFIPCHTKGIQFSRIDYFGPGYLWHS